MNLDVTLAVDALTPELGGIGRYAWELCRRLPAQEDISSLRFFMRNQLIEDPGSLVRGEELPTSRGLSRAWRHHQAKRALRLTVFHAPNYFLPARAEMGVATVHDLSVFRYPETHPSERIREFERHFTSSLQRAAHVLTDTETVRRELIDMFGVRPDLVTSVALGVSDRFKPRARTETARHIKKWHLDVGGYGLCVSALEPRKKVRELLTAWRRLPRGLRDAFPLVFAGNSGWKNNHIYDDLSRGVAEGWLRHLGYVAEVDLPHLYAGAALFLYPSIYEGFGLPPVEAMACGVPIIVARRSCLPEVCGDAARYIDPEDDNDFLTSIQECLENSAWKAQAIRRGLERAAGFTWERCVNDTVTVYRQIKSH